MHMTHSGRFGGSPWSNISVQEMIQFHGMVLKMSVDHKELGGYASYFTEPFSVNLSRSYCVLLTDYPAWAVKIMTLRRFKQIRAAFHPETGTSTIGDKCHQIRHALNTLNTASLKTFTPGINLSFDEGGVASRSRFNPVRQYNKDKPQKFRVDFFVLCNNSPQCYFIIHCDVYQGKNEANIGIPAEICNLPTTRKAVVNAIIQSKLGKDPNGYRRLFMDNRYSSVKLFILLREKFDILCAGTTRVNHIGWPKQMMTMTKKASRGSTLRAYDSRNKIMCIQWMDNRVVSLTSSLQISGEVEVTRRSGSEVLHLSVDKALKAYQENMDGVDCNDQYRERGMGFASKSHYKKWYKRQTLLFLILWF